MHRVAFHDGQIIATHEFADSQNIAEAFGLVSLT